ncbi:methyl-accepting chemotaxis protein [Neptunicella marina]|uniref:Methyl-accepting chemotaxis protein n=1 Tax=Neptunicella marina TaxID=2125989 RepID=A0A8J6LZR0_9ALTE|nr:methyl-accepting chemotaxis protein [Neptunicella marina]MBC3766340.1 methyl-accepting chemotaxis protein [Neptunicella marina]
MKNISIKQKIAFSLILSVLITAAMIVSLNLYRSTSSLKERVMGKELPNVVQRVAIAVDREINQMQTIARQIATDPLILDWNAKGQNKQGEILLIKKLAEIANRYHLSATSFADRQTGNYWNQDGFLRQLQDDERDGWFYTYTRSGKADLVSTYHYENTGKTDLFVNFQQVNGRGLSGIAKSFDSVIDMMDRFKLEQSGFVFLVDDSGLVEVHKNTALMGKKSLADVFGHDVQRKLLADNQFNVTTVESDGRKWILASSIVPSTGWYVMAQVPYDEVFSSIDTMMWDSLLGTLVVVIITGLAGWVLAGRLTRPLHQQARMFKQLGQGDADLSYRLPEQGEREILAMVHGYNEFAAKLQQVFDNIAAGSQQVNYLVNSLQSSAQNTMHSSQQADQSIAQMSAAMSQINVAVGEIAQNADNATQTATEVDKSRNQVSDVVSKSRQDIEMLGSKIDDVANVIETLTENTETIEKVLEVIQSISDQTNLLALNAAIEAARAGEQGRGFSVVADEVRSLAQKTADSTLEIQQIMDQLQHTTKSVGKEITTIVNASKQTSESIHQAEAILAENRQRSAVIMDMNRQIAVATEQQAYSIQDINSSMQSVGQHSSENMSNVERINADTQQLTELVRTVDSELAKFRK